MSSSSVEVPSPMRKQQSGEQGRSGRQTDRREIVGAQGRWSRRKAGQKRSREIQRRSWLFEDRQLLADPGLVIRVMR